MSGIPSTQPSVGAGFLDTSYLPPVRGEKGAAEQTMHRPLCLISRIIYFGYQIASSGRPGSPNTRRQLGR